MRDYDNQEELKRLTLNHLNKLIKEIENGNIRVVEHSLEIIPSRAWFDEYMGYIVPKDNGFRILKLTYQEK